MSSLRLRIAFTYLVLIVVALGTLQVLPDTRNSLAADVVVVTILAVLLGFFLSRSILGPLTDLTEAARRIAAGDQTARVERQRGGEVGMLIDTFNQMADTVEQQMAAASQERQRLAAALNSSVDAVIATDAQGNVLYANLAAERLFQRPASEIAGHPFAWTLPHNDVIAAIRASREHTESRATLIERPGRQYLQVVTTPIFGGGDWGVLIVFHDLTDVKRTEQVRRDFVANVGHELRTPLAAIRSVVDTLLDGAIDQPEVARDFLGRADSEVDRLVQMVEELLELSRIESGDLPLTIAKANLAALIGDAVNRLQPQAERRGVALKVKVDRTLTFPLDARRIEHAIVNLMHNAIKFTPKDGEITISAEEREGALTIEVADSGIGIAPEDLPRIFERFYKVDQSRASVGSGLGLAVVKHTAEAHQGSVRAASGPGRGSVFTLTIPSPEA